MALFSYSEQPGCAKPPGSFKNLLPGSLVELHGWFDDDTPTGGAVGVVAKVGDKESAAVVRFVKAESGFHDWHLRFSNPEKPVLVQLWHPDDLEWIGDGVIDKWKIVDPTVLPEYLNKRDGENALKLVSLVSELLVKSEQVSDKVTTVPRLLNSFNVLAHHNL